MGTGLLLFTLLALPGAGASAVLDVPDVLDIEPVWSGHPVGFSLLTAAPYQYVAYYDANRQLTVAQRTLDESTWTFCKLPTHVQWDSHNYVTMALDRDQQLHVTGNMHCVPLIYFRTKEPRDASTLTRVPQMVGPDREQRVTYPVFLRRADNQLVFRYRDGRSGNGDDIYNAYDEATGHWQRLMDSPLTSGEGKMNAYCSRPVLGPDQRYHVAWVWRDTPDCATNHDLSYARSPDLVHWETAAGTPLQLPITLASGAVVDPVPAGGGIINGGHRLSFDVAGRPVLVYHKFDAEGNTQIYSARFEDGQWRVRQISQWSDYRWEFSGGGSIPFEVRLAVTRSGAGLEVSCRYGRGGADWLLSGETLEPLEVDALTGGAAPQNTGRGSRAPRPVPPPGASQPGLALRTAGDLGGDGEFTYQLRWYTQGPNRDRPRTGPPPQPVMLQLLRTPR